jgi:hypothetical protein
VAGTLSSAKAHETPSDNLLTISFGDIEFEEKALK